MYLHKDLPVGESVKRVLGEKQDEKVQELINLLLEKSEAETKAIDDLSENQNNLLLLLSVVFNLIALDQDKMTVELYLSKGEAGVPEKFRKGKEE
jgi:hypothetical protein